MSHNDEYQPEHLQATIQGWIHCHDLLDPGPNLPGSWWPLMSVSDELASVSDFEMSRASDTDPEHWVTFDHVICHLYPHGKIPVLP